MASNKDSMLFKALFVVILIITSSQYVAFGRLHISDAIPHYRSGNSPNIIQHLFDLKNTFLWRNKIVIIF